MANTDIKPRRLPPMAEKHNKLMEVIISPSVSDMERRLELLPSQPKASQPKAKQVRSRASTRSLLKMSRRMGSRRQSISDERSTSSAMSSIEDVTQKSKSSENLLETRLNALKLRRDKIISDYVIRKQNKEKKDLEENISIDKLAPESAPKENYLEATSPDNIERDESNVQTTPKVGQSSTLSDVTGAVIGKKLKTDTTVKTKVVPSSSNKTSTVWSKQDTSLKKKQMINKSTESKQDVGKYNAKAIKGQKHAEKSKTDNVSEVKLIPKKKTSKAEMELGRRADHLEKGAKSGDVFKTRLKSSFTSRTGSASNLTESDAVEMQAEDTESLDNFTTFSVRSDKSHRASLKNREKFSSLVNEAKIAEQSFKSDAGESYDETLAREASLIISNNSKKLKKIFQSNTEKYSAIADEAKKAEQILKMMVNRDVVKDRFYTDAEDKNLPTRPENESNYFPSGHGTTHGLDLERPSSGDLFKKTSVSKHEKLHHKVHSVSSDKSSVKESENDLSLVSRDTETGKLDTTGGRELDKTIKDSSQTSFKRKRAKIDSSDLQKDSSTSINAKKKDGGKKKKEGGKDKSIKSDDFNISVSTIESTTDYLDRDNVQKTRYKAERDHKGGGRRKKAEEDDTIPELDQEERTDLTSESSKEELDERDLLKEEGAIEDTDETKREHGKHHISKIDTITENLKRDNSEEKEDDLRKDILPRDISKGKIRKAKRDQVRPYTSTEEKDETKRVRVKPDSSKEERDETKRDRSKPYSSTEEKAKTKKDRVKADSSTEESDETKRDRVKPDSSKEESDETKRDRVKSYSSTEEKAKTKKDRVKADSSTEESDETKRDRVKPYSSTEESDETKRDRVKPYSSTKERDETKKDRVKPYSSTKERDETKRDRVKSYSSTEEKAKTKKDRVKPYSSTKERDGTEINIVGPDGLHSPSDSLARAKAGKDSEIDADSRKKRADIKKQKGGGLKDEITEIKKMDSRKEAPIYIRELSSAPIYESTPEGMRAETHIETPPSSDLGIETPRPDSLKSRTSQRRSTFRDKDSSDLNKESSYSSSSSTGDWESSSSTESTDYKSDVAPIAAAKKKYISERTPKLSTLARRSTRVSKLPLQVESVKTGFARVKAFKYSTLKELPGPTWTGGKAKAVKQHSSSCFSGAEEDGDPKILAQEYIQSNGIYELFQHLTTKLIIETPDNPLDFLIQTVRDILVTRSAIEA